MRKDQNKEMARKWSGIAEQTTAAGGSWQRNCRVTLSHAQLHLFVKGRIKCSCESVEARSAHLCQASVDCHNSRNPNRWGQRRQVKSEFKRTLAKTTLRRRSFHFLGHISLNLLHR